MPDTAFDGPQARLRHARAPRPLLLLGIIAGAGLAGAGLVRGGTTQPTGLPPDAAARVNDRIISRDLVARVTRDVAARRGVAPDDALRQAVVDGLIDEELLIQRGVALGLPRIDRRVRSGLTRAAIERIMRTRADATPSDAALQAFLDAHPEIFAPGAKLRVRQMVFRIVGDDAAAARARAQRAADRVRAGEDFAAVRAEAADPELAAIPDALLTRAKLLDYVGPAVVEAAAALALGATSNPVLSGKAFHLVQVVARDHAALPELARVRAQVLSEYQRRAGDEWLRATLDRLRADADIATNDQP